MSNVVVLETDMTDTEQKALAEFTEQGMPGIGRVADSDVYKWFNLYMSGKSYEEITHLQNARLPQVLFIARKFEWFKRKMNHLGNIHAKIGQKVAQSQLESSSFLVDYIAFIHKKLGTRVNDFLAGDLNAAEGVSSRELEKYFKAVEALTKLNPTGVQPPQAPQQNNGTQIINNGGTVVVGDGKPVVEVEARPLGDIAKAKRKAQADAKAVTLEARKPKAPAKPAPPVVKK